MFSNFSLKRNDDGGLQNSLTISTSVQSTYIGKCYSSTRNLHPQIEWPTEKLKESNTHKRSTPEANNKKIIILLITSKIQPDLLAQSKCYKNKVTQGVRT